MKMSKQKFYIINGRKGQYELTMNNGKNCFFMLNTDKYEYFPADLEIKECI